MRDPRDALMAEARLGNELEIARDTALYRYLVEMARAEEAEAVQALKAVDPTDAKAVAAAQVRAGIADAVVGWIDEQIERGREAYRVLVAAEHIDG
ncbi:hypothetical protein E6C67_14195 [Azospirillum sp. TSA2s]|uniref:hypothetical protein n=1 Tax=Azospirillum sp. TSA2s TaxID=709810 RepID=UPI0010AA03EA|nr:hypothetical protein [Azospirillum sp. TSA2s]QCG94980.1 hypothetical protein E6C67_14195 [Azospirillum sp. TSA2s]